MRLSLALGALLALSPALHAATITYTEVATGSGTFDGTAFSNALITFSATGSTANVTQPAGGVFVSILPTTVTVAGLHTDNLSGSLQFVSNQNVGDAGLGDITDGNGILFTSSAIFNTYQLTSAIGPVFGSSLYNSGHAFATSGGSFTLNSVTGNSTFQAFLPTVASTPEPSSLILLATGGVSLAGALRRRLKR